MPSLISHAEHLELSKINFGKALNDPALSDVIVAGGDGRYYCHQVSPASAHMSLRLCCVV
jgi:hypothetical protein